MNPKEPWLLLLMYIAAIVAIVFTIFAILLLFTTQYLNGFICCFIAFFALAIYNTIHSKKL